MASAQNLGARSFDATDALRAAEPGAFLDGDLHMTAKGQRALAEAVAETLAGPPPLRPPARGLPEGRSALPTYEEWTETPETTVRGSSAAHCETVQLREWLRVTCRRVSRARPTGVVPGAGAERAIVLVTDDAADFIVPLQPGTDVHADFHWRDTSRTLEVTWEGDEASMAFVDERAAEQPESNVSERAARVCACHKEVVRERPCRNHYERFNEWTECDEPTCEHAFGTLSDECFAAYEDDCEALLHCVQGDGVAPPSCAEGEAALADDGQCHVLCDDHHPCAEGVCTPYGGGGICVTSGS